MKTSVHTRIAGGLVALAITLAAAAPADARQTLVDIVKGSIAAYPDPAAAVAAGWMLATGCVSGPQGGAMGFHYVHPELVDDDELDPRRPEALIYEQRNGRTAIAGAEFIVVASVWDALHSAPPVLQGQHFQFVDSPNRYGLPAFYELHVWAIRPNPTGAFADWHPHVTCEQSQR